jgi:hypothetical protein
MLCVYSKPAIGAIAAIMVIGASSSARVWTILNDNLEFVPILTVHPDQSELTGELNALVYTKPWYRIGPYMVGVLAGLIMFKTKGIRVRGVKAAVWACV